MIEHGTASYCSLPHTPMLLPSMMHNNKPYMVLVGRTLLNGIAA